MHGTVNYIEIGDRIRYFRRSKRWTQQELAARTGVTTAFIGYLERGEKKPSLETMVKLGEALGVGLDRLVAGGAAEGGGALYADLVALVARYAP